MEEKTKCRRPHELPFLSGGWKGGTAAERFSHWDYVLRILQHSVKMLFPLSNLQAFVQKYLRHFYSSQCVPTVQYIHISEENTV
jgi:uncharacterized protein YdgA (DUF945 family)